MERHGVELHYVRCIDRQRWLDIGLLTKDLLQRYIKSEPPPLVLYLKLPDTCGAEQQRILSVRAGDSSRFLQILRGIE